MNPRRLAAALLADDAWRYALVGGLASVPFTATIYLLTGNLLSLFPVFFGAVLAGYLAGRKVRNRRVGVRSGLVGAIPLVLVVVDLLVFVDGILAPPWVRTIVAVVGVALLSLVVPVVALIGIAGAKIGGWLATLRDQLRDPTGGI